jgi:hypothetical protein
MQRSRVLTRAAFTAALFISLPLFAAQPYHLELEASPGAVFPYLGKFGDVDLHVYAGGVRAEAFWLNSFSRTGAQNVTVANPLGRMYVEIPVTEIAPLLRKLAGSDAKIEQGASPTLGPTLQGKVGALAATRHRLIFGPSAYIDVWTTNAVPENAQLRRIVNGLLEGISPGTAKVAAKVPGTPVYVELNFRRFKKVALLKLKKLSMTADDEKDALELGPLYIRAGVLDRVLDKK